ncbi:polymorphic outer membrane protein middle domain-containing protein [Candidatus Chlamydia sanziniae]|uniref:Outer membrane protein pmp14 n=1 Tax=Candidatus Chlamydia sanziniae TaxID=1806891 RepID=A0A1A9HVW0_9CHLA|nr:polymorphic outer membrane protein middle domain-containing protein [Candidatus Chlamydia sanziniae]ANH78252.1 putative outer membrane protein pmp14 precursor [Candidatus Chlamydia sanziniae]
MPLSFKSSSFYFFACLCGTSWASGPQTLYGQPFSPPFFDQGEELKFRSDYIYSQISGIEFPTSFLGSSGNLSLLGNGHSLCFSFCQAPMTSSTRALLSATKTLTFTNFSTITIHGSQTSGEGGLIHGSKISFRFNKNLIFTNNKCAYSPASTTSTGSPTVTTVNISSSVIQPTDALEITGTTGKISFLSNIANFGSAIGCYPTASVIISNNSAPMEFAHNFSTCAGGVLHYGSSIIFKNNSGDIVFTGNSTANSLKGITPGHGMTFALGAGGAICIPTGSLIFTGNTGACTFSYNATADSAGAIYAQQCVLANRGPFTFHSNTATKNGGAICAKSLDIDAYGPMVFKNNRAEKGGAIYISPTIGGTDTTSKLRIAASRGDVIFTGNMLNTKPGIRNAITVDSGDITDLCATSTSRLIFYDPITQTLPSTGATSKPIIINSEGSLGSVIFSSENLSTAELLLPGNKTTTLLGNVTVAGGELRITQNAIVKVLRFTASAGQLTLGTGATLELGTPTGGATTNNITIGKLGFDVASFLDSNFATAAVNASGKTVTVSGGLTLVSDDNDELYDITLLKNSLAIPVVTFTGTTVTHTDFPDGDIFASDHYGYQGRWTATWLRPNLVPAPDGSLPGGTTPPTNTLYALWTTSSQDKAMYLFSPERRGELVSNTLWISFLANQACADALQETLLTDSEGLSLRIKGLGVYAKHNSKNNHEGFGGRYGGYQAILSMHYPDNTTLGGAFGQLYGTTYAHPYDSHDSGQISILSFFGRFPLVTQQSETLISWEACYGYTTNNFTTQYKTLRKTSTAKGRWHNNSYSVLISAEHPFLHWCLLTRNLAQAWGLSGFISAEFLGGWQHAFTEKGALARHFSRGRGYNVALPFGCSAQWQSPFKKAPSLLSLKVAYKPDILRVNPHNVVTIVSNQESTSISGAALRRHGMFVQIHDIVDLSKHTKAFIDYTLEGRRGYTNNRISLGWHGSF